MKRKSRRRLAIVRTILLIACTLMAGSGSLAGGAMAASGTSDPSVSVYFPLLISGGVRVLPNHFSYVSIIGSLWIVGEVQNDTAQHLELAKVTANVFSSSGQLLTTAFSYIDLDTLPPGEKTCFDILVGAEPAGWAYYEFKPPTFQTTGGPWPNLAILNDSGSYNPTYGGYEIAGQVRNDHGTRLEYVKVVGTVYTASGTVVGCRNRYVDGNHLDPSQIGSFDLTFSGRDYADAQSYRLQADGNPP